MIKTGLTLSLIALAWAYLGSAFTTPTSAAENTEGAEAVSLDELLNNSELWTFQVQVDPEKVKPELRSAARFPAVLLRVEQGEALIDFGRNGIHSIPIASTNLLHEAGRIKRGEAEADLPNFIRYTTNLFSRTDETGKRQPYPVDEYSSVPAFVIIYGDERLVEIEALQKGTNALMNAAKEAGAMGIVMPTRHQFFAAAAQSEINWVIPSAHPRAAFLETLQHHPDPESITVVAVDAYGKILRRAAFAYGAAEQGLSQLQREIHLALD